MLLPWCIIFYHSAILDGVVVIIIKKKILAMAKAEKDKGTAKTVE